MGTNLSLKDPCYDDSNSDNDDGIDGAELFAAVEDGMPADCVLAILGKNPGLIRMADPVGNTIIHIAARSGNVVAVCKLIEFMEERTELKLKRGLMDTNVDGDTALHIALKNAQRKVAYHLAKAKKKAAIIPNNDGMTPYRLAEEAGYSEVSVLLILTGTPCSLLADVQIEVLKKGLMGTSSVTVQWMELYEAIMKGMEDIVIDGPVRDGRELLWHQNPMGETLLLAAVERRSVMGPFRQLVQFMISNGLTDVALLRNRNGNTALHRAVLNRQLDKALCLIDVAPKAVYQVNLYGISPLYMAVKDGHLDLVKHMVSQSCLLACAKEILLLPNHATLPHLAIKAKSFGTLQTLMENLPELINATNEKGWRPLSYAANKGYIDGVTYLLTCFPDSTEKYDGDGSLPIHKAVGGGQVNIIQAFLSHCPQALYHVDKKGRSVLHVAVRYGKADILDYLTKDINMDDPVLALEDTEGKTFMDYAELRQN